MKITENITSHLTLEDVEELIKLDAAKEGYDVIKITPQFEDEYAADRFRDGEIVGKKFMGFNIDLKRKPQVNVRTYGQFGDH
jgi:hypothetical protein